LSSLSKKEGRPRVKPGMTINSVPIRLRKFATGEMAIAVEQLRLVSLQRLLDSVDEDGFRGASRV